jgi:PTS system nitrogen regulatory IIA component
MDVARILRPESVRREAEVGSKKLALDLLSQTLAGTSEGLTASEVLEGLVSRERLGSTGLGESVAMPHARLKGVEENVGAFLRLDEPVDYDSVDGQPVDLLFGVLVPEECSDAQIKEIRELIQRLREPALQQQLREATDTTELYNLLTDSLTVIRRRQQLTPPGPCA